MLRYLIKTLEYPIKLNSKQLLLKHTTTITYLNNKQQQKRYLIYSPLLRNTETVQAKPAGAKDVDAEYIVPYRTDFEKPSDSKTLINTLRTKIGLSEEDVAHIMSEAVVIKTYRQKSLLDTIETLCVEGIKKNNYAQYPWLITLDKKSLIGKMSILRSINGFRDINDFVPFLRLQLPRLRRLVAALNRECNRVSHGNRVYYLSEKLQLPPHIVTKYISKRLFVLEMPLEMFKTNLKHMINYKVEPMSILKDLWGFRYAPHSVELRLKRASQAKKDKIMPWMVRCPERILQKSLQISLDELEVLGSKSSPAEYVGERLGFSAEEARNIMNRHPQVNSVRVTKIKEVLDYLLDEAKFTRYDIAQTPRILCHSLETTKQRIEELKQYGCRPSTLVIVCRSKREYEKFLTQWLKNYNPKDKEETKEDTPKDL